MDSSNVIIKNNADVPKVSIQGFFRLNANLFRKKSAIAKITVLKPISIISILVTPC